MHKICTMTQEESPQGPELESPHEFAHVDDGFERLWTPHRMAYINGERPTDHAGEGCPFCSVTGKNDAEGLIAHRGQSCYVVLNLFPYNPGHLLVCPYRHVGDLTDTTDDERAESMSVTADAMVAIRAASNPAGFNLGFNQGAVSGGTVNGHLHQHVVPRWLGDASFITVIGNTKSLPLLLSQTWELVTAAWPGRG